MFETKQLAALFAIAAGGLINAGIGAGTAAAAAEARPLACASTPATPMPSAVPATRSLHRIAERALLAQLRADLGDGAATLQLCNLQFQGASARIVEGRGEAIAMFDGSSPVPLEVTIAYDLSTQRIEQAAYLVSGPAPTLRLDQATRRRIADRIGSRLVLEFAGQPVDFALGRVEHLAAGREKLLVSGEGVASFAGEGAARTRFVATAERASGKLLTLQYELGEQIAQ